MSPAPRTVSLESARRLTVTKQHLAGSLPSRAGRAAIVSVVRELAYVQWDPVSVVAPSHVLSLWARIGNFRPDDLERLLWKEKRLFEHWTPMASLVLTEDYPIYHSLMRRYPGSLSDSWGSQRRSAARFLAAHRKLRARILAELRDGPRPLSEFSDHTRTRRRDGGWTPVSDVAHMLYHLTMSGDVMVVGHRGNQNVWGPAERFLPDWVDRRELTEAEADRAAAERAVRALGTATPREVHLHFVRGRYRDPRRTLAELERDGAVHRVLVEGMSRREERYIHDRDLPLLESLGTTAWEPRLSLLPPFDNMLSSSDRSHRLFAFDYVREQFLPPEKRRFGTYVLPILWGETFIGRIDPRFDRESGTLFINSVHAETGAPDDREVGTRVREAIDRLATFVGADRVRYPSRVPLGWKGALS